MKITHEYYFQEYDLSVEQYGEILVTLAYHGKKMPDNNKGYDVRAKIDGKPARIEVKSKRAKGASVVHCGRNKLGRGDKGMTHFAVILVDRDRKNDHSVTEAWLLSKEQAKKLRRKKTESKYINVRQLRKEAGEKTGAIKNITEKLRRFARSAI